ncbi:MAG TPA: hypothetical protein VFS60_19420 [Thermoanaerobaculia bacterium]|nr:hypothetical protein [Thermoanaerobaculia bacterium]
MLGFSVAYSNGFSEHLENRSRELERHYREGNLDLQLALNRLHDAVDSALAQDAGDAGCGLEEGLGLLSSCNDHLTAIGKALVRTRAELFERGEVDAADPLIAREPFFAVIDSEAMYRELVTRGAALPQRLYWDDLAARVRDGGARAGLRLLDRHLRELQSDLRTFVGEVESLRGLPPAELAPALHGVSRPVAAIIVGFTRLLISFTYFGMLCERASQLYEISTGDVTAAVAAAG